MCLLLKFSFGKHTIIFIINKHMGGENYVQEHLPHAIHYGQRDHHMSWLGYVVVEPDHPPQEDVH
jgi:hypothetical protein